MNGRYRSGRYVAKTYRYTTRTVTCGWEAEASVEGRGDTEVQALQNLVENLELRAAQVRLQIRAVEFGEP